MMTPPQSSIVAPIIPLKQKPEVFQGDISQQRYDQYISQEVIAVDNEMTGLYMPCDRLCLTQLCDEQGVVSIVRHIGTETPLLVKLLSDRKLLKVLHFARLDVAYLKKDCGVEFESVPLFCTKIASRFVRTYTQNHDLEAIVYELLGVKMDKSQTSTDWARPDLTEAQIEYAANDVRVLIPAYRLMTQLLQREGRTALAERCFKGLPLKADLDLEGFTSWMPFSTRIDVFDP